MRVLYLLPLIITFIIILSGCATREIVKTEYISVPTFCKVNMPQRPSLQTTLSNVVTYETFLSNLREILIYTDELEMALTCCTNGSDCITK